MEPNRAFAVPPDAAIDPTLETMFKPGDRTAFMALAPPNSPVPYETRDALVDARQTAAQRAHIVPGNKSGFIRDLPTYEYFVPAGPPLNFTLTEIIVLLPQWFRNGPMATRFLNNHLSSGIHLAIMDEYRDLGLSTVESMRARDSISDSYRKTMRAIDSSWKKAEHRAPMDWDPGNIAVNGCLPNIALAQGNSNSPSISYKSLANGLKKLPQGSDAADLTRALEYAMQNSKRMVSGQSSDFLFPHDIHIILTHIGYTKITKAHTDRAIVERYGTAMRKANTVKQERILEGQRRQDVRQTLQSYSPQGYGHTQLPQSQAISFDTPKRYANAHANAWIFQPQVHDEADLDTGSMSTPDALVHPQIQSDALYLNLGKQSFKSGQGPADSTIFEPAQTFEQEVAAEIAVQLGQDLSERATCEQRQFGLLERLPVPEVYMMQSLEQGGMEQSGVSAGIHVTIEEVDALIARHQTYVPFTDHYGLLTPSPTLSPDRLQFIDPVQLATPAPPSPALAYSPSHLLRLCIEADDHNDFSDLARAARWARGWPFAATDWTVADLHFVLASMDSNPIVRA
ncbi:hypothetical protein ACN47E_008832 [Coniothyrium glycines]